MARRTDGYSSADLSTIVMDAKLEPMRIIDKATHFLKIKVPHPHNSSKYVWKFSPCSPEDKGAEEIKCEDIPLKMILTPQLQTEHIFNAMRKTKPSVKKEDVEYLEKWNRDFGQPTLSPESAEQHGYPKTNECCTMIVSGIFLLIIIIMFMHVF